MALADRDQYAIQVVITPSSGTVDSVTVQLETSNDGRSWASKNPFAEVFGTTPLVQTYSFHGYDLGSRPAGAMVRLRVQLGGSASAVAQVRVYVRQVSAPPFIPPRLGSCLLWLRADLGITLAPSTQQVARWQDMTNGGFDAVQATSTRQPTIAPATGLINGQATVFFDPSSAGSEKIMGLNASLAGLTEAHVFLVHKRTSTVPASNSRAGFWRLGASANSAHVPFTDGTVYDDTASTTRLNCGAYVFNMANPSCYEVKSTSTSWTNFINGTQQGTIATNTVSGPANPEIGGNSTVATYYDGYMAELVLFTRVLSALERDRLVKYFNDRYALGMT